MMRPECTSWLHVRVRLPQQSDKPLDLTDVVAVGRRVKHTTDRGLELGIPVQISQPTEVGEVVVGLLP